ncbi:LLM class flavin-dependent oxidoreductase, partial [Methylobacterium crusticola]|uniref:LLM class flavin-dependent oxidoreductase n=1 Tax=Methylobacterium crusticola TaxID=1697972 RepID=UPI001EE21322
GTVVVTRLGFVAKSRARARALVEKPLLAQYRRYSGWMKDTPEGRRYRKASLDDFQGRLILGTPEECIEQVAVYRDMGADTFVYHCQHQGIS